MKYGQIIFDPHSEEAKALVGKEVVASDSYLKISKPDELKKRTFIETKGIYAHPFGVDENGISLWYTFIREVIEEKPTYRPYESCEEMVEDFKKRFMTKELNPAFMPLIWLKNKSNEDRELISHFGTVSVYLVDDFYDPKDVFDHYTYLDGSPVGKEVC